MFDFHNLTARVVAAPMAGGPTTPQLVAAAERGGGIGFLAAGYQKPAQLSADIATVRTLHTNNFGVNIFVPEQRPTDFTAVAAYRETLLPYARDRGVSLPEVSELAELVDHDDYYQEKLELVAKLRVPVVSFTFGCPTAAEVSALHSAGSSVGVTVTSAEEALHAAAAGADWVCAQGPNAGGHRSTFDRYCTPPSQTLEELIGGITETVSIPIVATGGISCEADAIEIASYGVAAVQIGTVLLRTDEAGTLPAHADALPNSRPDLTVVTRAFSGRAARGLRNEFIDLFEESAVPEYPAVNTLTGALRRASSADPQGLHLWAGTGHRHARVESAASTIRRLAP